jgi:hypothetical protein
VPTKRYFVGVDGRLTGLPPFPVVGTAFLQQAGIGVGGDMVFLQFAYSYTRLMA